MFMQIIQGHIRDEAGARKTLDHWLDHLQPGAPGWLGGTYGITEDNLLVACVRFASEQEARANSERPEQADWWLEMGSHFTGDVEFHDCSDVTLLLGGGSDEAGFVQVIQGRVRDVERLHHLMEQTQDLVATYRGDVLGATLAIDADGFCTQTVAFTSEDAARRTEAKELPAQVRELLEAEMELLEDVQYLDLPHPWFATARR